MTHDLIFFGHHKCGSRFFRFVFFDSIAKALNLPTVRYTIPESRRPFHFDRLDMLDLENIDMVQVRASQPKIILFSNATARSLNLVQNNDKMWLGLRVIRDPRQILASNYFHHTGDHIASSPGGWVWVTLKRDQPILRSLPLEDGLIYELDHITGEILEEQISEPFDDSRVLTVKLENFSKTPYDQAKVILDFLSISRPIIFDPEKQFKNPKSSSWRECFSPRVINRFKEQYGDLLIKLGYEKDNDWN